MEEHRRDCTARCESAADEQNVARTFPTLAAAKSWRQDTQVAIRRGEVRASSGITVAEAAAEFLAGMETGAIRNRKGGVYKPAARRGYERDLRLRVLPRFGSRKLADCWSTV